MFKYKHDVPQVGKRNLLVFCLYAVNTPLFQSLSDSSDYEMRSRAGSGISWAKKRVEDGYITHSYY